MQPPKKVLLVDDEHDIRASVSLWLSSAGFEILTSDDGEDVLATANEQHPDVIVMDVRMPRKNGLVALQELQADSNLRHIPVVMLSASLAAR